jgi:hypothetical protein
MVTHTRPTRMGLKNSHLSKSGDSIGTTTTHGSLHPSRQRWRLTRATFPRREKWTPSSPPRTSRSMHNPRLPIRPVISLGSFRARRIQVGLVYSRFLDQILSPINEYGLGDPLPGIHLARHEVAQLLGAGERHQQSSHFLRRGCSVSPREVPIYEADDKTC